MRRAVINTITEFAKKEKKAFMIVGDAGYGVMDEFCRFFPERFLNLGVAEQNMIGFSAGLAMAGFKVFVYDIIPFLLYRAYEQIRNDICYQRLPLTLIGIGSGITYAPQGITHYAVEDIIIARSLPNLIILSPSDPLEAKRAVEFSFRSKNPVYIRIAKSGEKIIHQKIPKSIQEPLVIEKGEEIAILFHGSIAPEVLEARRLLKRRIKLISLPMLQPLNFEALKESLKNIHTLITVEEHFLEGGLGSIIGEWLMKEGVNLCLKKVGIKNEFIHAIKNPEGMRKKYKICAEAIKKAVLEVLND